MACGSKCSSNIAAATVTPLMDFVQNVLKHDKIDRILVVCIAT
jgi:hypothetical protein